MTQETIRSQALAAAFLAASPMFATLDNTVRQELAQHLQLVHLAQGEVLFAAGDRRDAMFFVLSGRLELRGRAPDGTELPAQILIPGQPVGEFGLVAGGCRTNTARALEGSDLLGLTRVAFDHLCEKYPDAMAGLPRTIVPPIGDTLLAGVLADLLGELDTTQLQALLAEIRCLHLARGDILVRQGENAGRMFVVVFGRLRMARCDAAGVETLVDEIGKGDTVGEQSLLSGDVHSTTVYAVRDSAVGVITHQVFENLQRDYPDVMARLSRIALRRAERRAAMPDAFHAVDAVSFALVPVGTPRGSEPLQLFAERLAAALSAYGPTLHLSSARLDRLLDQPGIAQAGPQHPLQLMLAGWLLRQEQSYSYVVYEADSTASAWTERCLGMADRILLVGRGASAPVATELDEPLTRWSDATESELVLLQPDNSSRPSGTAAWLARYPVAAHHHVRLGRAADFESFVRRVTGRGLGLVLGGGAARGFAHIGVFRALEECGVTVDYVGGTSIGAVLGATFALGLDYQTHMQLARQLASPMKLFDPTMPVVSFFASGKGRHRG